MALLRILKLLSIACLLAIHLPAWGESVAIQISTDNANEVYLNGVLLGTGNNWQQSSSYTAALLSGTNVLAVKGIDAGGMAAMIAELSWPGASAVSGATWKVSTSAPAGWEAVGFNDSAWVNATSYGQYGVAPWYKNVAGFPTNSTAKWIWSANSSNDNTVYFRYTFTVGAAPLAVSTTTLPNGVVGASYNQTLAASGGTPPYAWSVVSGALPTGLTLTSATGIISGTPTVAGSNNFTVRVTDANSATANQALSLTVASAPPASLNLTISADNANEVYLNGVLLGTGNNWQQSSSYTAALLSGTNVLAVKGIDAGGVAAMIAELSWPGASAMSGATWKVSTSAPAGWEAVGFNDSAWVNATSYGQYGVAPWYKNVAGFPTNSTAKWIWSASSSNDNTVYLRYTFTVGVSVNQAPTVSLQAPSASDSFTAPATFSIIASAADSDGSIQKVEFYNGAALLGSATQSPYLYDWINVPAGSYILTAKAYDNANASTTSAPVNITVNAPQVAPGIYYIFADHLNTPRVITDQTNKTVWRWDSDAFGTSAPFEDPDGDGVKFGYNLRFPGQYYDAETGLHQNYYRDYDPSTGRYPQSDPIGLEGGSFSTYSYANQNPISNIDPLGLMGNASGASQSKSGPIAKQQPSPPPPSCDGEWWQLTSHFLPGKFETFLCKCRWICKTCEGGIAGRPVDTYGVPSAQGGYTADWEGRGLAAKQKLGYGSPTQCNCTPPTEPKKCEKCEKR